MFFMSCTQLTAARIACVVDAAARARTPALFAPTCPFHRRGHRAVAGKRAVETAAQPVVVAARSHQPRGRRLGRAAPAAHRPVGLSPSGCKRHFYLMRIAHAHRLPPTTRTAGRYHRRRARCGGSAGCRRSPWKSGWPRRRAFPSSPHPAKVLAPCTPVADKSREQPSPRGPRGRSSSAPTVVRLCDGIARGRMPVEACAPDVNTSQSTVRGMRVRTKSTV